MSDFELVPPAVRRFLLRAGGWEWFVQPITAQHSLEQALEARYYLSDILKIGWCVAFSQSDRYALCYPSPRNLGRGVAVFLLDEDQERIHMGVGVYDRERTLHSGMVLPHPSYSEVQRALLRCQDFMDGYRKLP